MPIGVGIVVGDSVGIGVNENCDEHAYGKVALAGSLVPEIYNDNRFVYEFCVNTPIYPEYPLFVVLPLTFGTVSADIYSSSLRATLTIVIQTLMILYPILINMLYSQLL